MRRWPRNRLGGLALLLLTVCWLTSQDTYARKLKESTNLKQMLYYARWVLARPEARRFLRQIFEEELTVDGSMQDAFHLPSRVKDISETQFLTLLQYNEEHWPALDEYLEETAQLGPDDELPIERQEYWEQYFKQLLNSHPEIKERFKKCNDPTMPFELKPRNTNLGYRNVRFYCSHSRVVDNVVIPADDLVAPILQFINGAKKQLAINVFDFDLIEIADALIEAGKRGVEVVIGIDDKNIEEDEEVQVVFEKLHKSEVVTAVAVDAVGLNHQKVGARDWDDARNAAIFSSTANFTRSGMHPRGDLAFWELDPFPKESIPNANHTIVIDSQVLALLVQHELSKGVHPDPNLRLRGTEFPLSGVFQVNGKKDGEFFIMAFTPQGALDNVNKHLVGNMILEGNGAVYAVQFAMSSDHVENALLELARRKKKNNQVFQFYSVGEGPFATANWSVFLSMIGWARDEQSGAFFEDPNNPWNQLLTKEEMEKQRRRILIGPKRYGTTYLRHPDYDGTLEITAKIHHKQMVAGNLALSGSFNLSGSAEMQSEQLLVTNHSGIVANLKGVFHGLKRMRPESLHEVVRRRQGEILESTDQDPAAHYRGLKHGNQKEALLTSKTVEMSRERCVSLLEDV